MIFIQTPDISKYFDKNLMENWYLRLVLQIGPGASLAALSWDFMMLVCPSELRLKK